VTPEPRPPEAPAPPFRPCPHCGRVVAAGARCPYCLDGTRPAPPPAPAGPEETAGDGRLPIEARGLRRGAALPRPLVRRPAPRADWAGLITVVVVVGALFAVLRLFGGEPPLSPRPPDFDLHAGPTVTAAQAQQVLSMVEEAEVIFAGHAGGHLPFLDVFVEADRHALAADLAAWTGEIESDAWRVVSDGSWVHYRGAIFIDLTPPALPVYAAFWRIAHEVGHAFQQRLYSPAEPGWKRGDCWFSHGSIMAPYGPMWLLEGSAQRLAFRAVVESSHWDEYAQGRTEQQAEHDLTVAGYAGSSHRLEFLANATYLAPEDYGLAFAAVGRLEERSSPEAVVLYWKRLGDGLCWNEAFERTFGITAGEFYDDFEMQRLPAAPDAAG